MKKIFIPLMVVIASSNAFTSEFMEFGSKDFKEKKMDKSRWIFDIGANYMAYPTVMPNSFKGAHETIKEKDTYDVYGVNLGIGGELNLGAGISSTIKVGGFYSKTLDKNIGQAAKDIDLELANSSSSHMIYGGEASASLNYMIETSVIGIQPFVEFGLGTGVSDIEKSYEYKGLAGSTNPNPEYYNMNIEEGFNYAKTAAGINFISNSGIVSYIKVSNLGINVTKRESKGSIQNAGDATRTTYNEKKTDLNDTTNVMMASVGFGFMF